MFQVTVLTKVTSWDFEISNLLKKRLEFNIVPNGEMKNYQDIGNG